MPRRRKPHRHEVRYLPFDPATPFSKLRALYCRLSDDDAKSVSIEHQIQAGITYAEERGLVIAAVYIDWRTGLDADRLALKRLIEDAHNRKHPGVIIYDHYRFHRGVTGAYPVVMLHMQLPEYTFEATRDGYDIANIGIWAGISGMELETTRRRSMEQRRTRAEKGQWMAGMKPYWLDRNPKTLEAVINAERAAVFLQALTMYAQPTGTARDACSWLTQNAPIDPKAGASREWSSQRFRNLLRNSALWGDLPYARGLDVKDRVDGRQVIRKRIRNPQAVPFRVQPLIHKDELERAQCRLEGGCHLDVYPSGATLDDLIKTRDGKAGGRPYALEHPLRHVSLLCACGWRVRWAVRRRGERKWVYVACAAKLAKARTAPHVNPCGMGHLPVDAAEKRQQGGGRPSRTGAVWPKVRSRLIEALRDPTALAEDQRRQVLAEQEVEARDVAEESRLLSELDAALDDLDARENRLYTRYDNGDISKNVYDRQAAEIGGERREREERKRQLLAQRLLVQRAEQAVQNLSTALGEIAGDDPSVFTDQDWSEILPDLVDSITLNLDGEPAIRWHRPA